MVAPARVRGARGRGDPHLVADAGVPHARGGGRAAQSALDHRSPLTIAPHDRVAVFGATLSGKSALINAIASRWDRRLVYEPKNDPRDRLPNTTLARAGAAAASALPGCVQYTPWQTGGHVRAEFDLPVRRILAMRGHAIVIHEGVDLGGEGQEPGPALATAVYQGAGLGIPMLYAFQDPIALWRKWFTQATIVVVFYLQSADHRALLARHLGPARFRAPVPFDHSFLVWRRDQPERVLHLPPLALPPRPPMV